MGNYTQRQSYLTLEVLGLEHEVKGLERTRAATKAGVWEAETAAMFNVSGWSRESQCTQGHGPSAHEGQVSLMVRL